MAKIDNEIEALHAMSRKQLLEEWQRVCETDPPPLSADLLRRAIAYRMQELAYGGLSPETLAELRRLAAEASPVPEAPKRQTGMRAGARLLRSWRGTTHVVVATDDGFEWQGATYGSLSQVARAITGTPWSGPKFFGIGNYAKGKGARDAA
jgi:hypothetical protein